MEILQVTDKAFQVYGRILEGYDVSGFLSAMEQTPCPSDGVMYVASVQELEELPVAQDLQKRAYGGMPIEIGYCNGNSKTLNAVEYHRTSELDIAVSDLILLLGRQQEIETDFTYDTANMKAFYVPAGTAVELYATTLHYAPCTAVGEGFRCVIVLPKDTNLQLGFTPEKSGEDRLLTARNKWQIAHAESGIREGFLGLKGENISL